MLLARNESYWDSPSWISQLVPMPPRYISTPLQREENCYFKVTEVMLGSFHIACAALGKEYALARVRFFLSINTSPSIQKIQITCRLFLQ